MTQYIYETKCRRCGNLSEHTYGNSHQTDPTNFGAAMSLKSRVPVNEPCMPCGKSTLQDLVSYESKEN